MKILSLSALACSFAATTMMMMVGLGCSSSDAAPSTPADASSEGATPPPPPPPPGTDAGPSGDAACDLVISDATGSNVGIPELQTAAGMGSTSHKTPQTQGIHAQNNTATGIQEIDITVAGDAPTAGASYTLDPISIDAHTIAIFTLSDVASGELKSWDAVGGGVIKVTAVTPGVVSSYNDVTFALDHVSFTPRTAATNNKATGDFKLTGQCKGSITK